MKAFLIDPENATVTPTDYDGQPHSLYSLFGSLLVDSHDVLNRHSVYASSEGFEKGKRPFFLGEKLLFGMTVVTGKEGFEDVDALISEGELLQITQFGLPQFYEEVFERFPANFNFDEPLQLSAGETEETVPPEWVLYAFNMADKKTKQYFMHTLDDTLVKGDDLYVFLKKMGEIALKAMR